MFELPLKKTVNSDKFRQPALHFDEHNCYTFAPPGTSEYLKYWEEEATRGLDGYTAPDGDWISGYFYFYLNYSRISKVEDREILLPNGKTIVKAEKIEGFPAFWDYDRAYYDCVDLAERENKHLVVLKARRKGFSYKGASMLIRNYFLIRGSVSYAMASEAEFLTKDGVLSKAWDMMSFVDDNTAWFKHRHKKDTNMHKRASFVQNVNGVQVEQGYKSEIMGITLKNDPHKARGKSGKLILFEEGGKFPNLLATWQVTRPSVEQDGQAYGLMIAYGTGGTEEADYSGLKSLFYEPLAYNCLPIRNVWDEGEQDRACGFFVPQSANLKQYMDSDGNTDFLLANEVILQQRDVVIENASDRTAIDRHICEQPLTPAEATLNISTNIFPKRDLIQHLATIRNSKSLRDLKQVGELHYREDGRVKFEQNPKLKDLVKHRIQAGSSKEGAVVIWEHPPAEIPYGLYIAGCDPYDHDQTTGDSLGSVFIYKRVQSFESWYDTIVAEYTGRPDKADDFYETVRKLLLYYKASLLYENERKGLFVYFSNKHVEYLLADTPGKIKDILKDTTVVRGKGVHMPKEIKRWMEGLIKTWLNEEYEVGKKNLSKIYSEALLEELIAYDPLHGNFDRVIAFGLCMIYREELYHISVKQHSEENKNSLLLFSKPLFLGRIPNK
ncbi:MAG: hypothetical protein IMZ64_14510 [Bacteroidetes bacterium]|nr:hypothetical protein [Bacteroidota bacterium]